MQEKKELTIELSRAARGLLNWTVKDLADAAGVNADTILRWENGRNQPRAETLARLQSAFEKHGVVFFDDGSLKREA